MFIFLNSLLHTWPDFKINATKSVVAAIQITGPFVDEDHIG